MVAAIVEAMFSSQILRKRGDSGKPVFNHLRLTKWSAADRDHVGHFSGRRLEISVVFSQHAFGKRKHDALQVEQVNDSVVVLEAIHSPHWGLWELLCCSHR